VFNVVKPTQGWLSSTAVATPDSPPAAPLRFGPAGRFELRPAEYRLLVDGQPAALGGRALDLLFALAARPGDLLTKDTLLERVWPGLVVEEGNLRVQVNALRRVLGDDAVTTVPGRGYRFTAAVVAPAALSAPAVPAARPVLAGAPAAPALIGRESDLAALEQAFAADAAAVTLVGPPGVGKSSLARAALSQFAAGRGAWVDLAPLTRGAQVPGAIARAVSGAFGGTSGGTSGGPLDEGLAVAALLRLVPGDAPSMLVLDNAEHLLDACAEWVQALRAAPSLRLLVTSQRPLAIAGEQVHRVEPLSVSGDAVTLLVERIGDADRRFRLADTAQPLLVALCRQLDGLPLALEMAAARVPLMGLHAVHDALAERFALLARGRRDAPARHRTLQAALDWSHDLLEPAEQCLFRALGVFAGGFTLDLALALLVDDGARRWDVLDGLAALVDRSLVVVDGADPPRYRLLDTMRAYALDRLDVHADEASALRRRHAQALLALFAPDDAALDRLLPEMDNAREAFAWARAHDLALAADISRRVAYHVGFTVWRQEVTDWLISLRPAMQDERLGRALPLPAQASWWSLLAYVLNIRRDAAARPAARQAVALQRQLGDPAGLRSALGHWVRSIAEPGGELDEATTALAATLSADAPPGARMTVNGALAEAARVRRDATGLLACREQEFEAAQALGMEDMVQAAETNVGIAMLALGRANEAERHSASVLARIEATNGDANGNLPWALSLRMEVLLALDRLAEARVLVPRSLAADRRFGSTVAWQGILMLLAREARWSDAGRLAGHAATLWDRPGAHPDRDERARLDEVRALVEARLGVPAAAVLAAEGRRLDATAAAALAARAG